MTRPSTLVVLRGSSGSGKSTVASKIHLALDRGTSAMIPQDIVRRTILRDKEAPGTFTVDLIESMTRACLDRGLITIVEGILPAEHYDGMFARLAKKADRALFYAFDLEFDETARRHESRPQAADFTVEDMRSWYHGWNPLVSIAETRVGSEVSSDDLAEHILAEIVR